MAAGQPVLIDFDASLFKETSYQTGQPGSVIPRDDDRRSWRLRLRQLIIGTNPVAARNAATFIDLVKVGNPRPVVLTIGGGAIGEGAKALYEDDAIRLIGTDVYASHHTRLVADGHSLPFTEDSFDGVWIQAVLEHVLEPHAVAAEIFRVLKPGGIVYAETPFMQPVHEGAYDFTRFTMSGHRWLFKRFAELDAGSVQGAGTVAVDAVRQLWRSLGMGTKLSTVLTIPFFWLRFLDGLGRGRPNNDAASGFYFLGSKSGQMMLPQDMLDYYENQDRRRLTRTAIDSKAPTLKQNRPIRVRPA